ncbi:sigma-54-dependent Fis family transcriptional regulator [Solidesulfovibrio carbinolicus]|uniref:Sigma-54-dependent Fis family transcriptional regulator n=1 Tax=Solidesulfovibrio carbinolicus TaxID=296842 RepID=A0A4P6HPJ9_9BACT|nr:sigma 54-interacting transcriptional regulator [Solidesulfovibrio carbinolicus]QAZ67088.1 sigma-54-dependent Fis family transcriptional regulator [Solidesulfovibrio carbinolicus]
METEAQLPLSRERAAAVLAQWRRFQAGLAVDEALVRPVILRSWQRCRRAGFPADALALCPIDAVGLDRSVADNRELVDTAKRVMDRLAHSIHLSSSVVTLVDTTGLVLHVSATREDLASVPYGEPGRRCDEATLGTNGMGLCLVERQPVHVMAAEHFSSCLHYLSCSAAPIHDSTGRFLGALNLAISTENFHQHTLGLVEAAAHAIEEHLRLRALIASQRVILELLDDGVAVLGADGTIVSLNGQACSMLGLSPDVVGRDIQSFVRDSEVLRAILADRQTFHDREVTFRLVQGELSCALSCAPFADGGVILTLRETRRMRKYAARVAGAKAVYTFEHILGQSKALREAVRLARVAAQGDATTLLLGESGTGKELFAQAIHNAGVRRKGPFVVVNCGALPRNLVQSELFGYVAGAFSGALKEGSPGKFELADGGTLFLDEIGEMPLEAQVSLLRLLQENEVTRLGGKEARRVDVRIIAATNKDLASAVRNNAFRGDLYYRLNVLSIAIPPLRQREGDVPLLTRLFLDKFTASLGKPDLEISREALAALAAHHWPGNVRELENCIERLVNVACSSRIDIADLPQDVMTDMLRGRPAAPGEAGMSLKRIQRALILETLRETGGNFRRASNLLNISRTTLYAKLKQYGIAADTFREQ